MGNALTAGQRLKIRSTNSIKKGNDAIKANVLLSIFFFCDSDLNYFGLIILRFYQLTN